MPRARARAGPAALPSRPSRRLGGGRRRRPPDRPRRGGFDAGIRFGETVERDMVAVRVGPDLRTVVVGTPDYFARHPRPETPADLEAHNCVNYRLIGGGGLLPWEFARDGREIRVRAGGQFVSTTAPSRRPRSAPGAGSATCWRSDVAADLAAGRLVQVLDGLVPALPRLPPLLSQPADPPCPARPHRRASLAGPRSTRRLTDPAGMSGGRGTAGSRHRSGGAAASAHRCPRAQDHRPTGASIRAASAVRCSVRRLRPN